MFGSFVRDQRQYGCWNFAQLVNRVAPSVMQLDFRLWKRPFRRLCVTDDHSVEFDQPADPMAALAFASSCAAKKSMTA
jgi:hypothetical protein